MFFDQIPLRVLYAVSHSFPYSSDGYAVRTHSVASALVRMGCSVVVAARPGVPWDNSTKDFDNAVGSVLDGVRYVHTPLGEQFRMADPKYLTISTDMRAEQIKVFKPSVVLGASNWHNALPVSRAADLANTRFFYEVRGFWEISQAARDPHWENSPGFMHEVENETIVAKSASRVFTLNGYMRDELVRRGVEASQIDIVPNGMSQPARGITPGVKHADFGWKDESIIAYIGSFNVYEGVEDLICAFASLRKKGMNVALLLVGGGEHRGMAQSDQIGCNQSQQYRALAAKLGVSDFVHLTGRVSPDQIPSYYEVANVVAIPRRPFRVCEIVSPMKPLEAASYGKTVVMSDVGPLKELGNFYRGFRYFRKGDVQSLTDQLEEAVRRPYVNLVEGDGLVTRNWDECVMPLFRRIESLSRSRIARKPIVD